MQAWNDIFEKCAQTVFKIAGTKYKLCVNGYAQKGRKFLTT